MTRRCFLCDADGTPLYTGVQDHLFGTAGSWNFSQCNNTACGLIWIDPLPTDAELDAAYSAYYTHAPFAEPSAVYQRMRDAVLASRLGYDTKRSALWRLLASLHPGGSSEFEAASMFLPRPRPEATLLDVGCGGGDHLVTMRRLGWNTVGIDTDEAAVAQARRKGVDARLGSLADQNFPGESFDAVYLSHVIEHVAEPVALLQECRRIVKPGGTLIVLTPNSASHGHAKFGRDWRGLEPPRHLYLYNPDNIAALFARAAFPGCNVRTLSRGARTIISMSRVIRWSRTTARPSSSYPGLKRKVEGVIDQAIERTIELFTARRGEELLVLAVKE